MGRTGEPSSISSSRIGDGGTWIRGVDVSELKRAPTISHQSTLSPSIKNKSTDQIMHRAISIT